MTRRIQNGEEKRGAKATWVGWEQMLGRECWTWSPGESGMELGRQGKSRWRIGWELNIRSSLMPFKRFKYTVRFLWNYLQPVSVGDSSHVSQLQVGTRGVKESTGWPWAGSFHLALINLYLPLCNNKNQQPKKGPLVKQASTLKLPESYFLPLTNWAPDAKYRGVQVTRCEAAKIQWVHKWSTITITWDQVKLPGFPGGTEVKDPPANAEMQETLVQSQGWEDPLEKELAAHSSILDQRVQHNWADTHTWTAAPSSLLIEYLQNKYLFL